MQRTRGALIGSGVGAGVTFIAQQTQTTRLIEAGTDQYRQAEQEERARAREAADDERRAGRKALGRAAAFATSAAATMPWAAAPPAAFP